MIWFKSLLVILENKHGFKEAEKLSAILLTEAYFKFVNKLIIVVHTMRASEKAGVIIPNQYGGRKGHI